MTEIIIKADTDAVKKSFISFVKSYKEAICDYLNLDLRDTGYLADSWITVENDELIAYQVAPEKGYVTGENQDKSHGASPWVIIKWDKLPEGAKYIKHIKSGLTMYIKSEHGIPDLKIGEFKSIDDAVVEINSESVKNAVSAALESKKAQLKAMAKANKQVTIVEPNKTKNAKK